jgi:hypothetical protein
MLRDLCRYRVTKERDQLREDSLRAVRPAISGSRCIRRYTGESSFASGTSALL